jgi:hypothetical protein
MVSSRPGRYLSEGSMPLLYPDTDTGTTAAINNSE